jgi:serine/threonine-protein kinase
MTDDPRLPQLLDELLNSDATPEQVCSACPELLPQVRARWQEMRRLQDELDVLFPTSREQNGSLLMEPAAETALPQIPGYTVEGVLGKGGVGVVYRAWHLRLHRPVALKMLLAGAHAQPTEQERFQREAESVAALRHPNIVQVYDVGDVDSRLYFTMEFVEGGNLAEQLRGVPQPARQAAALVATLADAIQAAHQCGIVHRDLKPGNILLTKDGTPKVTDFGLARRLESGAGLTLSGIPMGTPSYMAPEQARGDRDAIGPATDIYALGAILYELLTGRPPFRSETASATLHQVVKEDPVLPRRLNRRVPRDLQTICLKCLHKEPPRRYATAQALADDLHRFERGEPIRARPVGSIERAVRWARRRPALAGALASGVLLATALVVTVLWWHGQQTALRAAAVAYAEADLNESERLRDRGEFKTSAAVLQRAKDRLGEFVPPEVRDRLLTAFGDLELVTRLETIRLTQTPALVAPSGTGTVDREYRAAFRDGHLADGQADPELVAERIRASSVRHSIVAALDDWAVRTPDQAQQAWCLQAAQRADGAADSWCHRARDPKVWQDRSELAELAAAAAVKAQSLSLLVALGRRLQDAGGDASALFQRILHEHPEDFWVNLQMGNALVKRDPKEAIGYFRAALALRPNSAVVVSNLAVALRAAGKLDEAIACDERALRLDPGYAPAHNNLGLVMRDRGKLDEAQGSFQRAIEANPKFVHAHMNLGNLLRRKGETAEAIACYQEAARLSPGNGAPDYSIGLIMAEQGRIEEAIQHYQRAVQIDPRLFQAHCNLGRLLTDQGRLDDAIEHLQAAITIEPGDNLSHKHLGRALQQKGLPHKALVHLFQSHYLKKEYLAAARLCADTFTADPKLADDLDAGHRFRAARAAALAGCGQGTGVSDVGEKERARWRQQAREWLRLDLAAWTKRLETAEAADRAEAQKSLAGWREDPHLAGLRDADALEKLPPAERQIYHELWREVADLLRVADPHTPK